MKNNLRIIAQCISIFIGCSFVLSKSDAQTIEMDRVETSGNKVIVHYKLEDFNPNHLYAVSLYSSKDNFATPLTRVTGDVGTEVKPGNDKKIIWDITNELGDFKGNLTFEVRGRVFIPFVKLINLNEGMVFKRGKNYPIVWTSGNLTGQVNIELFRDQERIWGENNLPNSGKYDWYVPGSAKKGSNYILKFTNTKDRNDVQVSLPFTIKPKTPLLIKAAALAVIGGGIAVLLGTNRSNPIVNTTPETAFAPWPGLPN